VVSGCRLAASLLTYRPVIAERARPVLDEAVRVVFVFALLVEEDFVLFATLDLLVDVWPVLDLCPRALRFGPNVDRPFRLPLGGGARTLVSC
jgi:hypothetical protein